MPSSAIPNVKIPPAAKKAVGAAVATAIGAMAINHRYGLSHDIRQLLQDRAFAARLEQRIQQLGDDTTLYHMLQLADSHAGALYFEGRTWTYGEMKFEVDRLATVLANNAAGVSEGDYVAVYMTNSPEMVFTMAALAKLGAVPALINSALRNDVLAHCMNVASAKLLLCTPDLAPYASVLSTSSIAINLLSFPPLEQALDSSIQVIRYEDLAAAAVTHDSDGANRPKRALKDVGALIYTSGTSGKPKAVAIKNFLLVLISTMLSSDAAHRKRYFPLRTFSCLPLFHATCLFTGLYYSVGLSSTFCLTRKFSASQFTRQLTESGATRMLYVGELCRNWVQPGASFYPHISYC